MYHSAYRAAWLSALFLPDRTDHLRPGRGSRRLVRRLAGKHGWMSIGSIQAFVSYITFMMWPVQDIARVFAEMQQAIASAERMFSLIDSKPQIENRPKAIDPGTIQR